MTEAAEQRLPQKKLTKKTLGRKADISILRIMDALHNDPQYMTMAQKVHASEQVFNRNRG